MSIIVSSLLVGLGIGALFYTFRANKSYATTSTSSTTSGAQQHSSKSKPHQSSTSHHQSHSRNIARNQSRHQHIAPIRHYQHSTDYGDTHNIRPGRDRPYSQRELRHMGPITGENALHNMGIPSSEIKNDSLYHITNYHKGQDPSPIHFNPQIHDNMIFNNLSPPRMINRNIDPRGRTHDVLLPDDTRMT